jgi:hypothetical protein
VVAWLPEGLPFWQPARPIAEMAMAPASAMTDLLFMACVSPFAAPAHGGG